MIALFYFFQIVLFLFPFHEIREGSWRGEIQMSRAALPFNFEWQNNKIWLINASEKLEISDISIRGDSIFITMPVFDSEFRMRNYGDSLSGTCRRHAFGVDVSFPFRAVFNDNRRFIVPQRSSVFQPGKYRVEFTPDDGDAYDAIGLFDMKKDGHLTGTFLTNSGDYRFLEGTASGDSIFLSAFDGMHAYVFEARVGKNNALTGDFYARSSHESWTAYQDTKYELPDPYSLTKITNQKQTVNFLLPDTDSNMVSSESGFFRGKPMIIQIMGSWCPNCMDESLFLASWYAKNQKLGISVVGLAFERVKSFQKAAANVRKMRIRYQIQYPLLIATKNPDFLPVINAFPTTVFVKADGRVDKIYTGFNGPATGKYYEKYKEDFQKEVERLLAK
jgi:thiol-disulfide isomerase/thioredoxin